MALNIKDPETDRLVRRLAAETGASITAATRIAVEERLARLRRRSPAPTAADELRAIARRGRSRTLLDDRSDDDILGLGPDGLPA